MCSSDLRGGNTHFSGAIFRFSFSDVGDIKYLVPGVEDDYPGFDGENGVKPYSYDEFKNDLLTVTDGRSDPELYDILIRNSRDTVMWVHDVGGVKMELATSVMGIRDGDKIKWPKGAIVRAIPAPGSADQPRSWFDKLNEWARGEGAPGLGYIVFEEENGVIAGKGCDVVQGYVFSRPRPTDDVEALLGRPGARVLLLPSRERHGGFSHGGRQRRQYWGDRIHRLLHIGWFGLCRRVRQHAL